MNAVRTTIAAVAIAAAAVALVASTGWAGTRQAPEIRDDVGDARYRDQPEPPADIIRGWFDESDGNLTVPLDILNFSSADRTRARLTNTSYHVAFREVHPTVGNGTPWSLHAGWTPNGMTGTVRRNGTVVAHADARAVATAAGPTIRWTDHRTYLSAGAELVRTHAWTVADDPGDNATDCHGRVAVDCAPSEGVGDSYNLSGRRPNVTVGDLDVSADRRLKRVAAGNATFFDVVLANTADTRANAGLSVDAGGWAARPAPANVTVPGNASNRSRVHVAVPADAGTGRRAVDVAVDTPGADGTLNLTARVTPRVVRDRSVRVTAAVDDLDLGPGGYEQTHFAVENVGDVRTRYDLSVHGNASSWATVAQQRVDLDPGNRTLVPFSVSVPDDAADGAYELTFVAEARDGTADDATVRIEVASEETPGWTVPLVAAGVAAAVALRRGKQSSCPPRSL